MVEEANVSATHIKAARFVHEHAPERFQDIIDGNVSIERVKREVKAAMAAGIEHIPQVPIGPLESPEQEPSVTYTTTTVTQEPGWL